MVTTINNQYTEAQLPPAKRYTWFDMVDYARNACHIAYNAGLQDGIDQMDEMFAERYPDIVKNLR